MLQNVVQPIYKEGRDSSDSNSSAISTSLKTVTTIEEESTDIIAESSIA